MNAANKSQQGFTLIEIMVVIVIVAVLAGISILSFSLAADRPMQAKALQLESWLQNLSERAVLDGTPYGVRRDGESLYALVYYRQYWFPLTSPEPFALDRMTVSFGEERDEDADDELPSYILNPAFIEGELTLLSPDQNLTFTYIWQGETGTVQLGTRNDER